MLTRMLVGLIRLYQCIFRWLPPVCRFRPTCSDYTIQALRVHGPWRGLKLGLWRILRCNPWCAGGDDPVPPRRAAAGSVSATDENGHRG